MRVKSRLAETRGQKPVKLPRQGRRAACGLLRGIALGDAKRDNSSAFDAQSVRLEAILPRCRTVTPRRFVGVFSATHGIWNAAC